MRVFIDADIIIETHDHNPDALLVFKVEQNIISFPIFKHKSTSKIMARITKRQIGTVEIVPLDRFGKPAPFEAGSFKFTLKDGALGSLVPTDKENIVQVVPDDTDNEGVDQLSWDFDADRGEGVKTISGFMAIEFAREEAVGSSSNITLSDKAEPTTTQAPADTTQAPAETTEAPAETTQAPGDTTEAPAETTTTPGDTTDGGEEAPSSFGGSL